MSERGDDISDPHLDRTHTVKVTSGCVELVLRVTLDRDGDIDSNEVEIMGAKLVEVDDDLQAAIYEKVGR